MRRRRELSPVEHRDLARLLNQAADNIRRASNIVGTVPFTDRALYVGGTLQHWLIDALREAAPHGFDEYQSIAYRSPYPIKKTPAKRCVPENR